MPCGNFHPGRHRFSRTKNHNPNKNTPRDLYLPTHNHHCIYAGPPKNWWDGIFKPDTRNMPPQYVALPVLGGWFRVMERQLRNHDQYAARCDPV